MTKGVEITEDTELKAIVGKAMLDQLKIDGDMRNVPSHLVTLILMTVEMMGVVGFSRQEAEDFVSSVTQSALNHVFDKDEDKEES